MRLDLICYKRVGKETPCSMEFVQITRETMSATNGHVIGVIPTEQLFGKEFAENFPDKPVYVDAAGFKTLSPYTVFYWESDTLLKCVGTGRLKDAFVEVIPDKDLSEKYGNYPAWRNVIPLRTSLQAGKAHKAVGLNMELAANLQKALGLPYLGLAFWGVGKPVYAFDARIAKNKPETEAYGVIMPMMLGDAADEEEGLLDPIEEDDDLLG